MAFSHSLLKGRRWRGRTNKKINGWAGGQVRRGKNPQRKMVTDKKTIRHIHRNTHTQGWRNVANVLNLNIQSNPIQLSIIWKPQKMQPCLRTPGVWQARDMFAGAYVFIRREYASRIKAGFLWSPHDGDGFVHKELVPLNHHRAIEYPYISDKVFHIIYIYIIYGFVQQWTIRLAWTPSRTRLFAATTWFTVNATADHCSHLSNHRTGNGS